jgi:hypothetical protein
MMNNITNIQFTPQTLASEYKALSEEYFPKKVKECENIIRKAYFEGYDHVWITFWWEDGDFDPIIKHFQKNGFDVGAPTGPDEGGETSFVFKWEFTNE